MPKPRVVRIMKTQRMWHMAIPAPFLRLLRWQAGDNLLVLIEDGDLRVKNIEHHLLSMTNRSTTEEERVAEA